MEKILTIIVPTYNMEKYLDKCLSSLIIDDVELLSQIEVLVIIDGAKDNSSEIAHSYEERYSNIFRVIDKENGNYGSCINRGIEEANGIYTRTLDADDWFDTGNFSVFLKKLLNQPIVDGIFTEFSYNYITTGEKKLRSFKNAIFNTPTSLDISSFKKNNWPYGIHSLTVRTDILKNHVRHQTGISYTDMEFDLYTNPYLHKVIFYNIDLYQYYIGRDGQTVAFSSYVKNYLHVNKIIQRWKNEISSGNIQMTEDQEYIISMLLPIYYKVFLCFVDRNDKSFNEFKDFDIWLEKNGKHLYEKISDIRIKGFPYIKAWRNLNLNYTKFPFSVFMDYYLHHS